jgi:transcriptional regulator with XRE-family HTH domain
MKVSKPKRGPSTRVEYWDPLAQLIMETIDARHRQKMSQSTLARKMGTKQSVISRFENMGRLPNYDFISRLALALGHMPGMTLSGEMMFVVPQPLRESVSRRASQAGVPVQSLLTGILEAGLNARTAPLRPSSPGLLLDTITASATRPDLAPKDPTAWPPSTRTAQLATIPNFDSANPAHDRGAA